MAQHHSRVSCGQERAWLKDKDFGSKSCLCCHPPQKWTVLPSDRSHLLGDGTRCILSDGALVDYGFLGIADKTHKCRASAAWHIPAKKRKET